MALVPWVSSTCGLARLSGREVGRSERSRAVRDWAVVGPVVVMSVE